MKAISVFMIIGAVFVRDAVSDSGDRTGKVAIAKLQLADGKGESGTIRIDWTATRNATVSARLTHLKTGWYGAVVYPRKNVNLSSCTRTGAPLMLITGGKLIPQWLIIVKPDAPFSLRWTGTGVGYDTGSHLLNRAILIYPLAAKNPKLLNGLQNVNNTMTPIACGVIRDINDKTEILPVTSTTTTTTTTTRRPTTSTTTTTTTTRPTTTTPLVDPTISPTVPEDDDYSRDQMPEKWLILRVLCIVSFSILIWFFCRYHRCHCATLE